MLLQVKQDTQRRHSGRTECLHYRGEDTKKNRRWEEHIDGIEESRIEINKRLQAKILEEEEVWEGKKRFWGKHESSYHVKLELATV